MTIPLSSLPNRNPVASTRCDARVDPYWDGLWGAGSQATWLSRSDVERAVAAGRYVPDRKRSLDTPVPVAVRRAMTSGKAAPRHRMLAAVTMWRSLTTHQLAALTGAESGDRRPTKDTWALWRAGLLSVGSLSQPLPGVRMRMPPLVRVDHATNTDELYEILDYQSWVGITGGVRWRWGSQFDRHNVLTTELALRMAELTSVPLVLGENVSTLALVVPGSTRLSTSIRAADFTAVRADGMRVMVEMTTSSSDIAAKTQRWADTLLYDENRSAAVLFVTASHPDRARGELVRQVRKAIGKAARASMGHIQAKVPQRMLMVDWRTWFPSSHTVDPSFLAMTATRPTETKGTWESVDLLDPFDLAPGRSARDLTAVLDNGNVLLGVPRWMSRGAQPDMLAGRRAAEEWPVQPVQQGRKRGSDERARAAQA